MSINELKCIGWQIYPPARPLRSRQRKARERKEEQATKKAHPAGQAAKT